MLTYVYVYVNIINIPSNRLVVNQGGDMKVRSPPKEFGA